MQETLVQFLGRDDLLEKGTATYSVFWPGEFHGLFSPLGRKELDTTEHLWNNRLVTNRKKSTLRLDIVIPLI